MTKESQSLRTFRKQIFRLPSYRGGCTLSRRRKRNQTKRAHTAGSPWPRRDERLGILRLALDRSSKLVISFSLPSVLFFLPSSLPSFPRSLSLCLFSCSLHANRQVSTNGISLGSPTHKADKGKTVLAEAGMRNQSSLH